MRLASQLHGDVVNAAEVLGNGFTNADDKGRYVGVPLLVISWEFQDSDVKANAQYAVLFCMTKQGEKIVITDGSTGIYQQLREYTARTGINGGLIMPNGLSESNYETCTQCSRPLSIRQDECPNCGNTSTDRDRARTFYLDLANA